MPVVRGCRLARNLQTIIFVDPAPPGSLALGRWAAERALRNLQNQIKTNLSRAARPAVAVRVVRGCRLARNLQTNILSIQRLLGALPLAAGQLSEQSETYKIQ